MSPNIVTIIQIRRGSTRLPDKVFMPLGERPLFVVQAERVQAAQLCGKVVIATTDLPADDAIAVACAERGLPCYRGDAADLLDRHYQVAKEYEADIVLKIPGDCPLIDPEIIDRVIGFFLENAEEFDYVSNLHPATYPDGNDVEVMHFRVLEEAWMHAGRSFEREHTTPYIWERPELYRIGNVVMDGGLDYSMSHRWTIDYPADYQFIKAVYDALSPAHIMFGMDEILQLLEMRPEIYSLNRSLAGVNWYRHHLHELRTVSAEHTNVAAGTSFAMTSVRGADLQSMALKVREHVIRMSAGGGCFIGASLSCVDLMVYLYKEFLSIGHPGDPKRDYLFLSKGHDVPALYGTLVEMGLLEVERLGNHLSASDHIYWHPNRAIPGVEFHSGSLGHLPAVAAGVALDCKLSGQRNRVIVITGDGELNEGSVWESLLVANAHGLGNLTLVVDRNQFQANMRTEDLVPLEPLADKFEAFGCVVRRVDGHDFIALEAAFRALPADGNKVNVIIADTVRGKGLPSIEERADRWFCAFTEAEVSSLLLELHGAVTTSLRSETLVVR